MKYSCSCVTWALAHLETVECRPSGHLWGQSLHGKVNVHVWVKQSILRALFSITHFSATFCSVNFCVKSAGHCRLQFSHHSVQCCTTNWNSETRNNYMLRSGEGVYVSCTGIEYRKKKKLLFWGRPTCKKCMFLTMEHNLKLTQVDFKQHADSLK